MTPAAAGSARAPLAGRALAGTALLAAVIAFPLVAGNYPVKLLQEILVWGVFAMSLDLLMGYAGMVSFGHSAFFGVGAYVAALLLPKSPGLLAGVAGPAEQVVSGGYRGFGAALIFDESYQPKPAYDALSARLSQCSEAYQ